MTSPSIFVRSQDQLAADDPDATGMRYTREQVERAFGSAIFREIEERDSALVVRSAAEPAKTIRERREELGFTTVAVAKRAGLKVSDVEAAENSHVRSPFSTLFKLATTLNLPDELSLGRLPGAGADAKFGVRLKEEMNSSFRVLKTENSDQDSTSLALALCEVAWVVEKQCCFEPPSIGDDFPPCADYGEPSHPAYEVGYQLAALTREILGMGADEPVESLRSQVMEYLQIPLVQLPLPKGVAGATVASNGHRGVALSLVGDNRNVWVRRFTLAHELGHLLWDPDERLHAVTVDLYQDLSVHHFIKKQGQFIEARANAFAAEFLAPRFAVANRFLGADDPTKGIREVMEEYGVSFTCARYQIENGSRTYHGTNSALSGLRKLPVIETQPNNEWEVREEATAPFFPESVRESRRGHFASAVVDAESKHEITLHLAAAYLGCSTTEFANVKNFLNKLDQSA